MKVDLFSENMERMFSKSTYICSHKKKILVFTKMFNNGFTVVNH